MSWQTLSSGAPLNYSGQQLNPQPPSAYDMLQMALNNVNIH
jgi:hypothetical protein